MQTPEKIKELLKTDGVKYVLKEDFLSRLPVSQKMLSLMALIKNKVDSECKAIRFEFGLHGGAVRDSLFNSICVRKQYNLDLTSNDKKPRYLTITDFDFWVNAPRKILLELIKNNQFPDLFVINEKEGLFYLYENGVKIEIISIYNEDIAKDNSLSYDEKNLEFLKCSASKRDYFINAFFMKTEIKIDKETGKLAYEHFPGIYDFYYGLENIHSHRLSNIEPLETFFGQQEADPDVAYYKFKRLLRGLALKARYKEHNISLSFHPTLFVYIPTLIENKKNQKYINLSIDFYKICSQGFVLRFFSQLSNIKLLADFFPIFSSESAPDTEGYFQDLFGRAVALEDMLKRKEKFLSLTEFYSCILWPTFYYNACYLFICKKMNEEESVKGAFNEIKKSIIDFSILLKEGSEITTSFSSSFGLTIRTAVDTVNHSFPALSVKAMVESKIDEKPSLKLSGFWGARAKPKDEEKRKGQTDQKVNYTDMPRYN